MPTSTAPTIDSSTSNTSHIVPPRMDPLDQSTSSDSIESTIPTDPTLTLRPSPSHDFLTSDKIQHFHRALTASKKLQQIIGFRDPEPPVRPPEPPRELEKMFALGLREFGAEHKSEKKRSRLGGNLVIDRIQMADLKGERESPVRAEIVGNGKAEGHDYTAMRPPPWIPGRLQNTFLVWNSSLPVSFGQVQPFPQALSHTNKYKSVGAGHPTSQSSVNALYSSSQDYNVSSRNLPPPVHNDGTQLDIPGSREASHQTCGTQATLFPSPRVQGNSSDTTHFRFGSEAPISLSGTQGSNEASRNQSQLPTDHTHQSCNLQVPQITVQSPSPTKIPTSKKRAPPLTIDGPIGPPLTRARAGDETGLPILPANLEAVWKFRFPGNTYGLMSALIHWSRIMQIMYKRYPNPRGFPYNPAFPWPVKPFTFQKLVAVSFYDTSVQPHKEIRFLGPGDAKEIIYGEVGVFRSRSDDNVEDVQEHQQVRSGKVEAAKKVLGISATNEMKENNRYMPMHHRATTGEGRWSYILIRSYSATREEVAPHMMIAFPVSAITSASSCLHTVFPDDHHPRPIPTAKPSQTPLRRLSSLQNLTTVGRNSLRLHQAIRSASSSEMAQATADSASILPQDDGQTLFRTVLKMDKAGSVPLIEGYRVDVAKFRGWLNAVGKGNGKLVMWKERK